MACRHVHKSHAAIELGRQSQPTMVADELLSILITAIHCMLDHPKALQCVSLQMNIIADSSYSEHVCHRNNSIPKRSSNYSRERGTVLGTPRAVIRCKTFAWSTLLWRSTASAVPRCHELPEYVGKSFVSSGAFRSRLSLNLPNSP